MAKFRNQASTRTTISRIGGSAVILSILFIGFLSTQNNADIDIPLDGTPAITEQNTRTDDNLVDLENLSDLDAEALSAAETDLESRGKESTSTNSVSSIASPQKSSSAAAFQSLNAEIVGSNGKIQWKTSYQRHIKKFEIQRSIDDKSYTTVGSLEGLGKGEHTQEKIYELLDESLANIQMPRVYYRIKQVGYDGLEDFSDVVEYEFGLDLGLYARIDKSANGELKVIYAADKTGPIALRVLNVAGQVLKKIDLEADFDPKELIVDASALSNGKYYLQLLDENTSVMEQFNYVN